MKKQIQRFWLENHGLVINEFALILPLMIAIWAGMIEVGNLHFVGRKLALSTQSVADLIAQERSITSGELNNIVDAGNAIMFPYPVGSMGYRFQSVEINASDTIVSAWLFNFGVTQPGAGTIPPQAEGLLTENDSTIYVRVVYTYSPILASLVPGVGDIQLTKEAFAKPRKINKIPLE